MARTATATLEERAHQRARYLTGLLWHAGAFIIINGFFWILDLIVGAPGLQWAYWITLCWGLALAFHALAWAVDGRQVEERSAERYLSRERRRSAERG